MGSPWISSSLSGDRSSLLGPPPLRVPSQPSSQGDCDRDRLQIFFGLSLSSHLPAERTSLLAAPKRLRLAKGTIRKSTRLSLPPRRTRCLLAGLVNYRGGGGEEEEGGKSASEIFARNFSLPRINVKLVARFIFMRHSVKDGRRWRRRFSQMANHNLN